MNTNINRIIAVLLFFSIAAFVSMYYINYTNKVRITRVTNNVEQRFYGLGKLLKTGQYSGDQLPASLIDSMRSNDGLSVSFNYVNPEEFWCIASPEPNDERYVIYNSNPPASRVFMVNQNGIYYADVNSQRLPIPKPQSVSWILYRDYGR